jgi:hypothetical protein
MRIITPPATAKALPLWVPIRASFPVRPPTMKIAPMMMELIPRMGWDFNYMEQCKTTKAYMRLIYRTFTNVASTSRPG